MGDFVTVDPHILERQAWGQVAVGSMRKPNANDQGHMLVANAMGKYYEAARQGKLFTITVGTSGTYKASVLTPPNVGTASWLLYNANPPSGNVCLVPVWISWWRETGTGGAGGSLALQVPTGEQTIASANFANTVVGSPTGRNGGGSNAYLLNAVTAIGEQGSWSMYPTTSPAASAVGAGHGIDPEGVFIIKPKHALWIEYVEAATSSPLGAPSIIYIETEIDCL